MCRRSSRRSRCCRRGAWAGPRRTTRTLLSGRTRQCEDGSRAGPGGMSAACGWGEVHATRRQKVVVSTCQPIPRHSHYPNAGRAALEVPHIEDPGGNPFAEQKEVDDNQAPRNQWVFHPEVDGFSPDEPRSRQSQEISVTEWAACGCVGRRRLLAGLAASPRGQLVPPVWGCGLAVAATFTLTLRPCAGGVGPFTRETTAWVSLGGVPSAPRACGSFSRRTEARQNDALPCPAASRAQQLAINTRRPQQPVTTRNPGRN